MYTTIARIKQPYLFVVVSPPSSMYIGTTLHWQIAYRFQGVVLLLLLVCLCVIPKIEMRSHDYALFLDVTSCHAGFRLRPNESDNVGDMTT